MASTEVAQRTPTQELVAQVRSDSFLEQIRNALPGNVTPARFQRVAITAIQQTPDLVTADRASLFGAIVRCAQDGLLPDGREAALTTRKDRERGRIAVYMPMIGGYRKIAAKYGYVLVADVVHERDVFEWSRMPPRVEHKPALTDDRGEIVCAYAAAFDGDWRFVAAPVVMTVKEIEKVRAVSSAATHHQGPWVQWWDRMAIKTVARRLFKELPLGDLEEIDSRIVEAADADAELVSVNGGLSPDEADIAAGLSNVMPPTDQGPDDSSAVADEQGQAAVAPVAQAAAADPDPEEGEWVEAVDPQPTPDPELVKAAGEQKVPGGVHKGKTLAELGATDDGQQWLLTQLRRLAPDDLMRLAVETYVSGALPEVWARYTP